MLGGLRSYIAIVVHEGTQNTAKVVIRAHSASEARQRARDNGARVVRFVEV